MTSIPEPVAIAALETILRPLGTSLKHYMPVHKAAAIEAMQGVLAAQAEHERERCAKIAAAANAKFAADQAAAKAAKHRFEARDFESMRIATAGLASAIRGEA